ncbi:MAG TPA: uroporphyrinogen-III C-methyltransferase [Friedmanniella sp.]
MASRRPTGPRPAQGQGSVVLVGGGPGDPGLITVAGLAAVRGADVVVTDRLAPLAVLAEAPAHAQVIDVAKIPRGSFTSQERINELLIEHARAGRRVVRLKGGDPFVFGRGGEEWQACAEAGLPVEVIPGVSSALAAPALAGVPLTHRTLTQGFTVVSGHLPPGDPGSTLDWGALARSGTTLVVLMGIATLPAITAELVARGLPAATPALTVTEAGLPGQRAVRGTVADIATVGEADGIRAPAVTVIGPVAGLSLLAPHATPGAPTPPGGSSASG